MTNPNGHGGRRAGAGRRRLRLRFESISGLPDVEKGDLSFGGSKGGEGGMP
jgi:hypothetical protein